MDKFIILREALNIFVDESEDEDDDCATKVKENKNYNEKGEDQTVVNKNENYVEKVEQTGVDQTENFAEKVVPRFSSKTFQEHFRINPDVFESIRKYMHSHPTKEHGRGRNPVHIDKQLMITLWYLGNQECLKSISDRFGVCITTSWRVVSSVCDVLLKINGKKKFIKWPTAVEATNTSMHYSSKYKLQGIIGCIDSSHIPIRSPIHAHDSYINKKGTHSVLLQGVCNEKMEFLYCYTGECGSLQDAMLLEKSGLENRINSGHFSTTAEQHLLGDSAYPLKQWLIPPFRDNGHLRDEQTIFNTTHSKCHVEIKRAFCLLKGRFRRLIYIDCLRPAAIVRFIIASCILHNICLQNHDFGEEYVINKSEDEEENGIEHNETPPDTSKRYRLMHSLF